MVVQRTQTITITLTEALRGQAFLNSNPLIEKVRAVPTFERAELYEPGGYAYIIRLPIDDTWQSHRGVGRKIKHKPWQIILLPTLVREWLFNYLHREIVAPLQFKLPLPIDIKEEVRLNLAKQKLERMPTAKFGAPIPKILQKRRRKMKKVVDIVAEPAIVVSANKNCDESQQ